MDKKSAPQKDYRLYALPETQENLGPIAARLPFLAGMPVMIIDASALPTPQAERQIFDRYYDSDELENNVTPQERHMIARGFSRDNAYFHIKMLEQGYDLKKDFNVYGKVSHVYLLEAQTSLGSSARLLRVTDVPKDSCIIVLKESIQTPKSLASELSSIPQDKLQVGGMQTEWQNFLVTHEAFHCRHTHIDRGPKLPKELYADRGMLKEHFGAATDDSFRRSFINARALGAMRGIPIMPQLYF